METAIISIIIPVYNAGELLQQCLDSVKKQTFKGWECILIDDGSSDDSGKICDEYAKKDERFSVIHQENQGVSAARNVGLDNAKGEWIGFVDADDWIENDYLMAFRPNELESGSLYVHSNYHKDNKGGSIILGIDEKMTSHCTDTQKTYMILERAGSLLNSPCLKLFQLSVIKENNLKFDKNISLGEDYLFVLSYLSFPAITKMYVKRNCGYHYVDNADSLVHRIVHPQDSIYFSEEGYRLKNKVLNNFGIVDGKFTDNILQESQNRLFSALHSNYLMSSFSNEQRKGTTMQIKELNKKYKHKIVYRFGIRNLIYSFILTFLSVNMINIFMKTIMKTKNHN